MATAVGLCLGLVCLAYADGTGRAAAGAPPSGADQADPAQTNRRLPASACGAVVTDTIRPAPVPVCATSAVTVTATLTCPARLPLHVVFVLGRHLAMQDHLDEVKAAARTAATSLDYAAGDRAGVVSLSAQSRVELDLTDRQSQVVSAINRLQLDPIDPFARYFDWIGEAQSLLERGRGSASPLEVIILYSTGCPTGFDSYCQRQIGSANQAKSAGMTVMGVCNPNARPFGFPLQAGHCRAIQQMTSSGYYRDLQQASRTTEDLANVAASGRGLSVSSATLTEELAPGLVLVPGSASPGPTAMPPRTVFQWPGPGPLAALTLTYAISATDLSPTALRTGGFVDLVDSMGRAAGAIPLPNRPLSVTECVEPTTTPLPEPSPTVTIEVTPAATTSPTPTTQPTRGIAYLPVSLQAACRPARGLDIVLVLDTSTSMAQDDGSGVKLEAASTAALDFVRRLDLGSHGRDQASVVIFSSTASVLSPLTRDQARLQNVLSRLEVSPGTRIDLGLLAAAEVLTAPERQARVPGAIVLLTDGQTEAGSETAAQSLASRLRQDGVALVVIGLGADVDREFLIGLAGGEPHYVDAPDSAALASLYAALATSRTCPPGSTWPAP